MKISLRFTTFVLTIVAIIFGMPTSAQSNTSPDKNAAVHISIIPPLSTNGREAGLYTNTLSFNMLAGVSKNELALTFGGLANVINNNSNGVQFAGLYNHIGNEGKGLLFSGLANNINGNYSGLQFAGLSNISKDVTGLQFAGLVNIADDFTGSQFAGLLNMSSSTRGFQFAGLINVTKNTIGTQIAGLANIAQDVTGSQLAGLVNISKNVSGVQIAGLINIANNSDTPIGILNLIRNGEYGVAINHNEIGSTLLTFRSGGKNTYGILGLGYNHKTSNSFVNVFGFGQRINCMSWLKINNELVSESIGIFSKESTFKTSYIVSPALRIGRHIEIFGGVSLNYMHSNNVNNTRLFDNNSLWKRNDSSHLQQIHVGYQFGVQYIF